jgi:hypothetical protein
MAHAATTSPPPSIDGPNLARVIRFEREGEERFARWTGAAAVALSS